MKRLTWLIMVLSSYLLSCGGLEPTKNYRSDKPDVNGGDGEENPEIAPPDDEIIIGQFRGYEAANMMIRSRMLDPETASSFTLGDFLGERHNNFTQGLSDLLGVYSGVGTENKFRNGTPNALNMVIWHIAFSQLSKFLAYQTCMQPDPDEESDFEVNVSAEFQEVLTSLCAWPNESARNKGTLENLWHLTMRSDAPQEEMDAFSEFFLSDEYTTENPQEAMADLVTVIMYNPYFLLRR